MKVYAKSKYWRINAIALNNNHDYSNQPASMIQCAYTLHLFWFASLLIG